MLAEPSSGSYRTTYLPAGLPGGTGTGTGSSSDAVTHTRPVNCTLWRTVSLANRASFCCRSPDTFTAPAEPRMSGRHAPRAGGGGGVVGARRAVAGGLPREVPGAGRGGVAGEPRPAHVAGDDLGGEADVVQ